MNSPEIRLELQRLLSSLCDGEIAAAEQARLEELLAADEECRRIYMSYMDMHARLVVRPWMALSDPRPRSVPANGSCAVRPMAESVPVSSRGRWIRTNLSQAVLVAGTLAASLLVQIYWWHPESPGGDVVPIGARADGKTPAKTDPVRGPAPEYVATLQQTLGCEWDDPRGPLPAGTRLKSGELRLPKGIASILFDSGPELVLEGPAKVRLESDSAVTVLSGKAVVRAADSDAPFDLATPSAKSYVDVGSEYAVSVSTDNEELQVFEGEVQRLCRTEADGQQADHLKAGEARHYQRGAFAHGRPAPFDPKRFVRLVATPAGPVPDPATGLIAYEGFDYRSPFTLQSGKGSGGFGWDGRWKSGYARQFPEGSRPRTSLNVRESLTRESAAVPSVGGSFDYSGFVNFKRKLVQPVRLDTDGVYYLSYLLRRRVARDDPFSSVSVLLWTDADAQRPSFDKHRSRMNIGVRGANQLFANLQKMDVRTSLPLNSDAAYLLIAKIVASKTGNDQVFLRLYNPDEPVDRAEPAAWSVYSPPFRSDLVFDWMQLNIKGKTRQTIDEIRLGVTWASVAAPWIQTH